jgi:hypothetical protein
LYFKYTHFKPHRDLVKGIGYERGDVVATFDGSNLAEKWPGRFEPLDPKLVTDEQKAAFLKDAGLAFDHPAVVAAAPVATSEEQTESSESSESSTPEDETPVDVTDKYPTAKELDLKVFKIGKTFSVATEADPTKYLNEVPLKSVKQVQTFIMNNADKV